MRIDVIKQVIELVPEVKLHLSKQVLDMLMKRATPKQADKNAMERKLTTLMNKRFKWESEHISSKLQVYFPDRKALQPPLPYDEWWDEWNEWDDNEVIPALINIILNGALGGVSQFADGMTFDMDWTTANQYAAKWARDHAGLLIKDLNDTSAKIIKDAITAFIETPGMTVGDTINQIMQTGFSEARSILIAKTETTQAYAEGQRNAAEDMRKENPDLTIYKTWFTDKSDRNCEICMQNEDVEVEMDEAFPSGDMAPTAHPGCNCWIDYRTRILG